MDANRLKIVGIANITTSEHVTSPQDVVGMISSGSSMAPQEICIFILAFLMLVIWKGKHAYLNVFFVFNMQDCKYCMNISVVKRRYTH